MQIFWGFGLHTFLGSILAYIILCLICLFAIVGFFTILKWIFIRKKKPPKPKKCKESRLEHDIKDIDRNMEKIKRYIDGDEK